MDEFLKELDTLLKKYNAIIFYTKNDDGLHVKTVNDEAIFWGDVGKVERVK